MSPQSRKCLCLGLLIVFISIATEANRFGHSTNHRLNNRGHFTHQAGRQNKKSIHVQYHPSHRKIGIGHLYRPDLKWHPSSSTYSRVLRRVPNAKSIHMFYKRKPTFFPPRFIDVVDDVRSTEVSGERIANKKGERKSFFKKGFFDQWRSSGEFQRSRQLSGKRNSVNYKQISNKHQLKFVRSGESQEKTKGLRYRDTKKKRLESGQKSLENKSVFDRSNERNKFSFISSYLSPQRNSNEFNGNDKSREFFGKSSSRGLTYRGESRESLKFGKTSLENKSVFDKSNERNQFNFISSYLPPSINSNEKDTLSMKSIENAPKYSSRGLANRDKSTESLKFNKDSLENKSILDKSSERNRFNFISSYLPPSRNSNEYNGRDKSNEFSGTSQKSDENVKNQIFSSSYLPPSNSDQDVSDEVHNRISIKTRYNDQRSDEKRTLNVYKTSRYLPPSFPNQNKHSSEQRSNEFLHTRQNTRYKSSGRPGFDDQSRERKLVYRISSRLVPHTQKTYLSPHVITSKEDLSQSSRETKKFHGQHKFNHKYNVKSSHSFRPSQTYLPYSIRSKESLDQPKTSLENYSQNDKSKENPVSYVFRPINIHKTYLPTIIKSAESSSEISHPRVKPFISDRSEWRKLKVLQPPSLHYLPQEITSEESVTSLPNKTDASEIPNDSDETVENIDSEEAAGITMIGDLISDKESLQVSEEVDISDEKEGSNIDASLDSVDINDIPNESLDLFLIKTEDIQSFLGESMIGRSEPARLLKSRMMASIPDEPIVESNSEMSDKSPLLNISPLPEKIEMAETENSISKPTEEEMMNLNKNSENIGDLELAMSPNSEMIKVSIDIPSADNSTQISKMVDTLQKLSKISQKESDLSSNKITEETKTSKSMPSPLLNIMSFLANERLFNPFQLDPTASQNNWPPHDNTNKIFIATIVKNNGSELGFDIQLTNLTINKFPSSEAPTSSTSVSQNSEKRVDVSPNIEEISESNDNTNSEKLLNVEMTKITNEPQSLKSETESISESKTATIDQDTAAEDAVVIQELLPSEEKTEASSGKEAESAKETVDKGIKDEIQQDTQMSKSLSDKESESAQNTSSKTMEEDATVVEEEFSGDALKPNSDFKSKLGKNIQPTHIEEDAVLIQRPQDQKFNPPVSALELESAKEIQAQTTEENAMFIQRPPRSENKSSFITELETNLSKLIERKTGEKLVAQQEKISISAPNKSQSQSEKEDSGKNKNKENLQKELDTKVDALSNSNSETTTMNIQQEKPVEETLFREMINTGTTTKPSSIKKPETKKRDLKFIGNSHFPEPLLLEREITSIDSEITQLRDDVLNEPQPDDSDDFIAPELPYIDPTFSRIFGKKRTTKLESMKNVGLPLQRNKDTGTESDWVRHSATELATDSSESIALDNIPRTTFSCRDYPADGYYPDVETNCKVFHVCYDNKRASFVCPVGTSFSRDFQVCVWSFSNTC